MACAIFISSSTPTTIVGGIELDSEFMHMSVDDGTEQDDELVREWKNRKTIGDSYASGKTIAWPSPFIR
jgi:hypothetical protein